MRSHKGEAGAESTRLSNMRLHPFQYHSELEISDLKMLKVFYSPHMVADSESFSPSAAKPEPVVASWWALGVPTENIEPNPATVEQLALAHDREFVRDVLAGIRSNGFGNRSRAVAASLPYTSGSMLLLMFTQN